MDPLVSLYYYAPVCAALNFVIMLLVEGVEPFYHLERVGAFVLFTNAGIAFALNVAAVFLIAVGSGLVLTLAGVLKDIVSRGLLPCAKFEVIIEADRLPRGTFLLHSSSSRVRSLPSDRPSPPSRCLDTRSPSPVSSCSRRADRRSRRQ